MSDIAPLETGSSRAHSAYPQFHDTVTVPMQNRPGGVIRVLITERGIVLALVKLFEIPRHQNKSLSWQSKACHAVGLMYDYCLTVPPPTDLGGSRNVLSNFVQKLMAGTIGPSGEDPTGLYWPAMSRGQIHEVVSHITTFADFCSDECDTVPLNALVQASFKQRISHYRRLDLQNSHSLLKHIRCSPVADSNIMARQVEAPLEPPVATSRPPAFPRDCSVQLLDVGFLINENGDTPWRTRNIRDTMIAILQRYGGLRESEPFHIFVTDVRFVRDVQKDTRDVQQHDTSDNELFLRYKGDKGHAEVRLYHPQVGRFSYQDPLTRKIVHVTRTDFLRMTYERMPRNIIAGKERAGWKNLMLDVGTPYNYATIRWFPKVWGSVFWQLYHFYITHVLPKGLNHPYLFVNLERGPQFGEPYHVAKYNESLKAAVKRIGLVPDKRSGTTSHGLRHAYAQDLSAASVPTKIIQVCLHQKSLHSQDAYTRPEIWRVQRELDAANRRLQDDNTTQATLSLAAKWLYR